MFASALQDWSTKWVPAILEYASTLEGKKAALVSEALSETRKAYEGNFMHKIVSDNYSSGGRGGSNFFYNVTGDLSGDDKAALGLLCKIFSKKNTPDSLMYIYEEYEVSRYNNNILLVIEEPGGKS